MSDRIFGLIVLALMAFYAWGTSLTQVSFLPQAVGPKAMPYGLAMIGALCGMFFLLRPDPEPSWPARRGWLEIGAGVLVMYSYANLLPMLGFVIASWLAAAYFVWRFMAKPIESLVAGGVIAVGIYIGFHQILGLSLAEGLLGF